MTKLDRAKQKMAGVGTALASIVLTLAVLETAARIYEQDFRLDSQLARETEKKRSPFLQQIQRPMLGSPFVTESTEKGSDTWECSMPRLSSSPLKMCRRRIRIS